MPGLESSALLSGGITTETVPLGGESSDTQEGLDGSGEFLSSYHTWCAAHQGMHLALLVLLVFFGRERERERERGIHVSIPA